MESILLWTIIILYGIWLILTIIRAFGYAALIKLKIPRFLWPLLPNWNLFAPKPGMTDYYVMYRDQSGSAEPGPWVIAYGPEPRKWSHGVWNPHKVQAKAVFDLVQQLAQVINTMQPGGEDDLMRSAPYLHLLHFIRHLPRQEAKDQTQFAIVVREPAYNYEATLIVSPYYSL